MAKLIQFHTFCLSPWRGELMKECFVEVVACSSLVARGNRIKRDR